MNAFRIEFADSLSVSWSGCSPCMQLLTHGINLALVPRLHVVRYGLGPGP